jgi:hypothetical protein
MAVAGGAATIATGEVGTMATGTRKPGQRWPRASSGPDEASDAPLDSRRTLPLGQKALVVSEPVRPSRVFRDLVAALGLPESMVRFIVMDVLDDPDATPETMTPMQLLHLGATLLRTIDGSALIASEQRWQAHQRVEQLLQQVASRHHV